MYVSVSFEKPSSDTVLKNSTQSPKWRGSLDSCKWQGNFQTMNRNFLLACEYQYIIVNPKIRRMFLKYGVQFMLATKGELSKKNWKVLAETNYYVLMVRSFIIWQEMWVTFGVQYPLWDRFATIQELEETRVLRATFVEIMYSWRISYLPRFITNRVIV